MEISGAFPVGFTVSMTASEAIKATAISLGCVAMQASLLPMTERSD